MARRRRESPSDALMRVAAPLMLVLAALGAAVSAIDLTAMQRRTADLPPASKAELRAGRPAALARWRVVHAALERRLDQPGPLEFGAVWRTRTGRVCGVVDGKASFGGWSGMKGFYTDGAELVFDDGDPPFQQAWVGCLRDHWIDLVAGSQARGACASRTGSGSCTHRRVE